MQKIITHSAAETQKFAREFTSNIKPGGVVTLSGELGAGKTTFVQGFAEGLGITSRIISPTFIIMRTYTIKNSTPAVTNFFHIDLYRLSNEQEIDGIGLLEILQDKHAITVIEWPERMGSRLPKKRWEVVIESIGEEARQITYTYLAS